MIILKLKLVDVGLFDWTYCTKLTLLRNLINSGCLAWANNTISFSKPGNRRGSSSLHTGSSRGGWGGDCRGQLVSAELITDCCRHGWLPSADGGSCPCPFRFLVTEQILLSFLWKHMLQVWGFGPLKLCHRCSGQRKPYACYCLKDPSQDFLK